MPTGGTTILHYEIGDRLGAGGMGEVYRARDTRLGREVALKFIAPEFRGDPERRARLLKEARAASALRSPAIATTFDIGESDNDLFIVMELVEGEQLSDRVARGPLPVETVLHMAAQVSDALDEAHALGIVHRDIKSANLILTTRGRFKVLDFGLAKTEGGPGSGNDAPTLAETQAGTVMGTVSYMSPEQALGKPVDHRSDLFSLGVVMYETLTARLPFGGDTFAAVVDQIIHREPPALARLNYDVPARLEDVVRKLLAKSPDARYQSARELLVDVKALRQELELEGRSGSTIDRPAATPTTAPSGYVVAVLPFANITREPADDWIGSGIAETVTADLKSIKGLKVLGRERVFDALRHLSSSSVNLVDEQASIDVGRHLQATWLVSGGYQRLGDQIRITARGVDVESGTVVRTVKIDGHIDEIFTLQDKIVYELARGINLTLNDSEVATIQQKETDSVEAYEARSTAMMNLMEGTPQALERAIHLLEKATVLDPNYAEAWAALGAAYDFKGNFLGVPEISAKAVSRWRARAWRSSRSLPTRIAGSRSCRSTSTKRRSRRSRRPHGSSLGTPTSILRWAVRTGWDGGTSTPVSRIWSVQRPSTPISDTLISSSGCSMRCVETTTRRKRPAAARSTCRSGSCLVARGCRSLAPTRAWDTFTIFAGSTTRRSACFSSKSTRSNRRVTRSRTAASSS